MPATPQTTFRIPADVKQSAQERAQREGLDLTTVAVVLLDKYGRGEVSVK